MSTPDPIASSPTGDARRWLIAVALLALFASALTLFTRHNTYPFYYHPDEYGKARQVVDGSRALNFNHPLLLLNVATPLKKIAGKGPDKSKPVQLQKATVAGRTASALFAATAVVALTVCGYLLGGIGGGLGTAIVLLLHPLLFEHAHIFKEDSALVMGLALTSLAAVLFWRKPDSTWCAVGLGATAALALSAKYLGITALLIALPVVLFAPGARRGRRMGIFFASFLVMLLIANRQMFTHLEKWRSSLTHEVGMSVSGARGVTAQDPVQHYLFWIQTTTPIAVMVFLFFNALSLVRSVRRRSLAEWLVFLFPFAFTAMLMLSPRVSDRYFLPAAVLFHFNALVGVGISAEWFTRAFGRYRTIGQIGFAAIALLLGWGAHFGKFKEIYAQYQVDDRQELEAWTAANLPEGSKVAQDALVALPDPELSKQKNLKRKTKLVVRSEEFVPDLGTLDELRAQGVRYVATTPKKSQRYTSGLMQPTESGMEIFEKRRAFYTALAQQGKLLWSRPALEIDTLHPGLELYDIGTAP